MTIDHLATVGAILVVLLVLHTLRRGYPDEMVVVGALLSAALLALAAVEWVAR